MKRLLELFFLITLLVVLCGCKKAESPAPAPASAPAPAAAKSTLHKEAVPAVKDSQESKPDVSKRKLIKEGEIRFETSDVNQTTALIKKAANELHGYVSEEKQYKDDSRTQNRMIIRVPAEKFDKLIETISANASYIEDKQVKLLDVTEEYIDVMARIKTQKDLETRYRQLLSHAKAVEDMIEIEKQMAEVREQIESAEGRLKYLNDRISYSTLTVIYYQRTGSPLGFASKFTGAFVDGWQYFVLTFIALLNIWPFIILCIVAYFLVKKYKRHNAINKKQISGVVSTDKDK
jgi:hypothetical protein